MRNQPSLSLSPMMTSTGLPLPLASFMKGPIERGESASLFTQMPPCLDVLSAFFLPGGEKRRSTPSSGLPTESAFLPGVSSAMIPVSVVW